MIESRYYTSHQFFSIMFLSVMIIYLVTITVLHSFKGSTFRKHIMLLNITLSISLLTRFVYEIIYLDSSIMIFSNISLALLLAFCVEYLYLSFRLYKNQKLSNIVNISGSTLILLSLILMFNSSLVNYIYIIYAIVITIISMKFTQYRVSGFIFRDLKDMINDYVFIIDNKGNVIYRSKLVNESVIFNNDTKIEPNNIEKFFNKKVHIKKEYNQTIIRFMDEYPRYFQYSKKAITQKNQNEGYIITFVEVSLLMNILTELDAKRDEMNSINIRLKEYKDKVYHIEKEKEVNSLLLEIAQNQYNTMNNLRDDISLLSNNGGMDLDTKISSITQQAKHALGDVRVAVAKYREYYDENK